MDFVKKNIKYVGVAGCLLAAIGTLLPFVKVSISLFGISSNESVNFIDGDGVFVIILAILSGVMIFGKTLKNIRILNINFEKLLQFWWGPIVPIGIGLAITAYNAINIGDTVGTYGDYAKISFGIGFYLIILGALVTIASILYEKFVMKVDNTIIETSSSTSTTYTQTFEQTVQPSSSVICPRCGAQMSSNSKFCTTCGGQLQ